MHFFKLHLRFEVHNKLMQTISFSLYNLSYNKDYPKFFTVVSYNNSLPNGGLQKGDILVKGGHTIMVTGIE